MKPEPFTIENITRWMNTRELPDDISLHCCLSELRYQLIVNKRLRAQLNGDYAEPVRGVSAKEISGPLMRLPLLK